MDEPKTNQIKLPDNRPAGISSKVYGDAIDALAFNLTFIALKNPKLAVEAIRIYGEARKITEDDPNAPDEDLDYFREELSKIARQ